MNEIVKYHNDLNKISLKGFGQLDYDVFMFVCAKMRDHGTNEQTFEYTEIRKLLGKTVTNKEIYETLNKISETMAQATGTIQHSENHRTVFVFFSEFDNNGDKGILKVTVNEKYKFILNALTANFTRFELEEFISLESKYAKTLYRLLKQFRTTGDLTIGAAEFREKLDIPKSYSNKVINVRVIKPAIDALKKVIPDLEFEAKRSSAHGNPIYAYRFTFSPEAPERQRTLSDWQKEKKTTKIRNNNFELQREHSDSEVSSLENILLGEGSEADYEKF